MSWSFQIGVVRGIKVYLHATFGLLIGWIILSHLLTGKGVVAALEGTGFVLLLFTCVLLHEFGHALTAQRFGVKTRDITLYPIGGIARLERIPRDPRQELAIALAGPAVNFVIAAGLLAGLLLTGAAISLDDFRIVGGSLPVKLLEVNILMAAFNLLPAFPMDGGRVLRAFLAVKLPYEEATRRAAVVGQGMAFLFGLFGLLTGQIFLLLIAFFVYVGASQEATAVTTEFAFRGLPVRQAMMTSFQSLQVDDPLEVATHALLAGAQHDFPVLNGEAIAGLLTRTRLLQVLTSHGPETLVGEAMQPSVSPLSPDDSLEETYRRMREEDVQTIPVVAHGRLVGLATAENLTEWLMLRAALGQPRGRRGQTDAV